MLDKSPELILDNDLSQIKNQFEKNFPNIILCAEPFHKAEFLHRLIDSEENPTIIIDMDFLYSGYVESGMIQKKENVFVYTPNKDSWSKQITEIISRASSEKIMLIIDSFNGLYTKFDDLDAVRFVNSCIMLLSSMSKNVQSTVVITAIARKKENDEWVLLPGGKQFMKSKTTQMYFLKKVEQNLIISLIGSASKTTFKIQGYQTD